MAIQSILLIQFRGPYVHYQSKVLDHPKKYSFLILKVLFLMKQVKHHNVFIYYT